MPKSFIVTSLLVAAATVAALDSQASLKSDYRCPKSAYTVHIFSQDPQIIYLENFILPEEIQHLRKIS
jgi:hypothetical protein